MFFCSASFTLGFQCLMYKEGVVPPVKSYHSFLIIPNKGKSFIPNKNPLLGVSQESQQE